MLNLLLIQLMKLMILIDSIQTEIPRVVLVEIDSQAGAGYLLVLLVERVDCVGRGYFENFSSLAQNAMNGHLDIPVPDKNASPVLGSSN